MREYLWYDEAPRWVNIAAHVFAAYQLWNFIKNEGFLNALIVTAGAPFPISLVYLFGFYCLAFWMAIIVYIAISEAYRYMMGDINKKD